MYAHTQACALATHRGRAGTNVDGNGFCIGDGAPVVLPFQSRASKPASSTAVIRSRGPSFEAGSILMDAWGSKCRVKITIDEH